MITAIANSTKEVVVAKGANGRDEFSCPDCQQLVYPRHRAKWTDHFVHKPNSACKTKLVASLEGDEHKLGKQSIIDWLSKSKRFTNPKYKFVTEKTVTTVDGRSRKIDVAVVYCDSYGEKVIEAHECQLSPICVETEKDGLMDRTIDYHRLGISVTWWMGKESESHTICDFFKSISPEICTKDYELLRVHTEDKKIDFYLGGYPIKFPNIRLQKMMKDAEKKEDDSQDKSQIASKLVARFLNAARSQLSTEEQRSVDENALEFCNDMGVWDTETNNLDKEQRILLDSVVREYSETLFGCYSKHGLDFVEIPALELYNLAQNVSDQILELSQAAIPKNVFGLAPECFQLLKALPGEKQVLPPELLGKKYSEKVLPLDLSTKKTETNVLNSLFKYGDPQTARTFIKEAITNALDQNPAEATALCAAWEQIEPTLKKDVKSMPIWVKQVTEEKPPLLANGNGNGNGNGRH